MAFHNNEQYKYMNKTVLSYDSRTEILKSDVTPFTLAARCLLQGKNLISSDAVSNATPRPMVSDP